MVYEMPPPFWFLILNHTKNYFIHVPVSDSHKCFTFPMLCILLQFISYSPFPKNPSISLGFPFFFLFFFLSLMLHFPFILQSVFNFPVFYFYSYFPFVSLLSYFLSIVSCSVSWCLPSCAILHGLLISLSSLFHPLTIYLCLLLKNKPLPPSGFFCCCCPVAQSGLTLCDSMDCVTPGLSVLHHLLEFAQTCPLSQ